MQSRQHTSVFRSFPALVAATALAAAASAQSGRLMAMPSPPVVGGAALFTMSHPTTAAGRFNFFFVTTPSPLALNLPIPGFTTVGLVRIDPANILVNALTVLDTTGTTQFSLAIPNVPTAAGFSFDVQTADLDFVVNNVAWADNDISTVVAPAPNLPRLVINEVDYDNVGADTAEFIEIYNAGSTTASLANIELRLVNGANSAQYASHALAAAGSLAPGQYLVVRSPNVTVAPGALVLTPFVSDAVQNGAPDGIALVDASSQIVIDALSYEGAMTAVTLTGWPAPISLVEGTVLPTNVADSTTVQQSLARLPNGSDSNNAAVDWAITPNVTPGAANQ